MAAEKFEVLTGREQILKRPQMWVGSMSTTSQSIFIVESNKVAYKEVSYIPAFKKIIDEIIDNSLDAIIQSSKKGKIKVTIDSESITVEDNGPGIPVVKKELSESELKNLPTAEAKELSNSYIPQIAWTRLFSGSNFQDSDDKTTIGSHGLGSKCASIFSTKFIGKTDDGKNRCTVVALNNLESSTCTVNKTLGKSGTTVQFWPDLDKFNLSVIDKIYSDLTYQRLICLSVSFPNIKFYFNGELISFNEKSFLNMFSDNVISSTFKNGFIGVFPNEHDEFIFFSYVNGLNLTRGGSHIDYISNQIITPIRNKLEKKYKNIKPSDIKNRLSLVVFCREFPNPKFDSQTKETLTNTWGEVSSYLKDELDFEKLSKDILKCEAIINPIIDSFRIKEELKAKSEIKKVKKLKISADKYLPPTGNEKTYLALCEGSSSRSGVSASLGRKGIGYYAMKGVPLNAYDSTIQKIVANQELKDIISILNLDISKSSEDKTISFDKVLITSDNDADGSHITSMLIGWFRRFAPNLFKEGRICKLITPLIIVTDKKENIKEYFFDVDSFKNWEYNNSNNKNKVTYLKGLGSWDREKLIYLIDTYGLDNFIQEYSLDDESFNYIEDWLGSDSEKRKEYLRNYKLDIDKV